MPSIAIVGPGRLGTAIALALADHPEYRVAGLAARNPHSPRATRASALLGMPVIPLGKCHELLSHADVVLLTVSDRALTDTATVLAEQWPTDSRCIAAHTAGSLSSEVLAPLRRRGVPTASFHPLQTFADPSEGRRLFEGAYCGLDGDGVAVKLCRRLAEALGMIPVELDPASRARYHAAAVLASNALVALAAVAADTMPLADGLSPLLPLMRTTLANVEQLGLPAALTGPIERGDVKTIEKHLQALQDLPDAVRVYRALADATLTVAVRKGSLDASTARAVQTLLQQHSHAHGGD